MLITNLVYPVSVLNLSTFNICLNEVQSKLSQNYHIYGWDSYLLQQNKIGILQGFIQQNNYQLFADKIDNQIWLDLYQGNISDNQIIDYFPFIDEVILNKIISLKPTRQRCISEYDLIFDNNKWHIERVPVKTFVQTYALKANKDNGSNDIDYRLSPRIFKDLPDDLCDDNLKAMLIMVANQVKSAKPDCHKLNIISHHNIVWCNATQTGSNSPEGIHQDGIEFIVSALCIERNNIEGGKSIVYGADKITPLFEIELQAGQGIFQPDAGSELWHSVTPIRVKDKNTSGFRATIGFDISVL
ncbi:MAG: hypothetical protein RLZZ210_1412 [Pseudomonadota bacterium]|jgi:hypothetical protein